MPTKDSLLHHQLPGLPTTNFPYLLPGRSHFLQSCFLCVSPFFWQLSLISASFASFGLAKPADPSPPATAEIKARPSTSPGTGTWVLSHRLITSPLLEPEAPPAAANFDLAITTPALVSRSKH